MGDEIFSWVYLGLDKFNGFVVMYVWLFISFFYYCEGFNLGNLIFEEFFGLNSIIVYKLLKEVVGIYLMFGVY